MNIEIISNPNSDLKETGFGAFKACNSVRSEIEHLGHNVKLNVCRTIFDLDKITQRQPDLVILAVKYISSKDTNDIWLADYFREHGINFSGSTFKTLSFDSNKVKAKARLEKCGLRTAQYFTATPGQFTKASQLPIKFPLFLKPVSAANGNGVDDQSYVTSFKGFVKKVQSIHDVYGSPVLVEEFLDGPEFTVAIAATKSGGCKAAAIEIVPPLSRAGVRILGEKVKKDDSEELLKIKDAELAMRVKVLALEAFRELGVRDFGRIDIRANSRGECFFVEANLVPGMTKGSSYFPKAFELDMGLSYSDVVQLVLEGGLNRMPKLGFRAQEPSFA